MFGASLWALGQAGVCFEVSIVRGRGRDMHAMLRIMFMLSHVLSIIHLISLYPLLSFYDIVDGIVLHVLCS
jgi:predicted membrane channel-forming protein YqfA (hemolysin III family)